VLSCGILCLRRVDGKLYLEAWNLFSGISTYAAVGRDLRPEDPVSVGRTMRQELCAIASLYTFRYCSAIFSGLKWESTN
jgi:hypothetical protein